MIAKKRFLIVLGVLVGLVFAIDNWPPYSLLSHRKRSVNPQPPILRKYDAMIDLRGHGESEGEFLSMAIMSGKTFAVKLPLQPQNSTFL